MHTTSTRHLTKIGVNKFELKLPGGINIRKAESEYYTNKIRDCTYTKDIKKKSWSLINSLMGKENKTSYINQLKVNDNVISGSKLMAKSLNNFFINVESRWSTDSTANGADNSHSVESTIINSSFNFSSIDVQSVLLTLKNLKANKSTGLDKQPAKMLKLSANMIAPSLTYIFNLSIKCSVYV